MASAQAYTDYGLVFAKEAADPQKPTAALGQPCVALVETHFRRIVKAAGVRPIKVHGTRHTSATLALSAGVQVHVVGQRLGHASTVQTLQLRPRPARHLEGCGGEVGAVLASR